MKRIFTTSMVFLTVVYVIPFIYSGYGLALDESINTPLTHSPIISQSTEITDVSEENKADDIEISVLIGEEVQTFLLEEYLYGVVAAEMPPTFHEEALKAQAVAARTYIMYKKYALDNGGTADPSHKGAVVCDDHTHCKAYIDIETENLWGDDTQLYKDKIKQAVNATKGEIITYSDIPIAAVFHSVSAEHTESAVDVWGTDTPYLISVESPGGDASENYEASYTFAAEEFRAIFHEKYPDMDLSDVPGEWFKASERSESGGIIEVTLGGVRLSGLTIREILGLNSSNFTIDTTEDEIVIHTIGYGHGVGMSQYGAKYLAENGSTYEEILAWYYTDTEIENIS